MSMKFGIESEFKST